VRKTRWNVNCYEEEKAMVNRREFLTLTAGSCLSALLSGCVRLEDLQPNCSINWAPSLLGPIFYGFKDYSAPAMRVYFPSLDGSPQNAQILLDCERYPLVIFVHGDCSGEPFNQWIELPAQLARSGYVVAVTSFGGVLADGNPNTTAPLRAVHDYMRSSWEFRDRLLPSPMTGIVGHSFGGTLAAQMATEVPVTCFASLSGAFGQMSNPIPTLSALSVPSLFTWNDNDDAPIGAQMITSSSSQLWDAVHAIKHGVTFEGAQHGDYMRPDSAPRCSQQGPCRSRVRVIAADFLTTFMAKYLSPEFAFTAFTWVPDSLFVRPQDLPAPPANGFYAGAYLTGFENSTFLQSRPEDGCVEDLIWDAASSSGSGFLAPAPGFSRSTL
jgi:dienelactone hydrolase